MRELFTAEDAEYAEKNLNYFYFSAPSALSAVKSDKTLIRGRC